MNRAEIIGNRIKDLEKKSEVLLDPNKPFIVRLDGHKFSKFTKGFNKPVDTVIVNTMISTTSDLVKEFNAVTAFTESDEITLVFPPIPNPESTLIYNGRTQKICSLMAGWASTRFNHWLKHFLEEEEREMKNKIGRAFFDARVFSVKNEEEAVAAVLWRFKFDTFRNGVNGLAQTIFPRKSLHKKTLGEIMTMLREKGVLLTQQNPHLLFGTFIKKKLVQAEGFNPIKKEKVVVNRTVINADQVKLDKLTTEQQVDFIMRKYW